LLQVGFLNFFVAIGLYFSTWLWRKKIGLAKLLGEEKMNGWEKFCTEFKLGQTPAINFVSSCLVTNDRVFITLRIILALWSLLITIFTWAGSRSVFFGTYYPLATIITIYVNRHRQMVQNITSSFWKKEIKSATSKQMILESLACPYNLCSSFEPKKDILLLKDLAQE